MREKTDLCGRVFDRVTLRGGPAGSVIIRGLCPEDKDKLIRFYERLSLETIYTRFFSIIRYFDPYVEKLIKNRALVVVAENPETGEIVGVAEAIPSGDSAEGGIVVLEDYQGRGLGTALALALRDVLRESGIRRVVGYILPENIRALRLVKKLGGRLKRTYESMILVEIPVPSGSESTESRVPDART